MTLSQWLLHFHTFNYMVKTRFIIQIYSGNRPLVVRDVIRKLLHVPWWDMGGFITLKFVLIQVLKSFHTLH